MTKKETYFEDLDFHVQEILVQLIASIIENKKKQEQEEEKAPKPSC